MTVPVDDLSLRTGSVPSLVLTIVGLYLRRTGGWMSTAALVRLAGDAGASGELTRSAITRLKKRGVLTSVARAGTPGYAFEEAAHRMFRRGDRRIFAPRRMTAGDDWCLVSFSLPEEQRSRRHQLRRRLANIGCGTVAQALWICPEYLADEVEEILEELGIRASATLFRTGTPRTAGPLSDALSRWWDLPALETLHRAFVATVEPLVPVHEALDDAEAFRRYVVGIDAWRDIPYLDPGLPFEHLSGDWPGRRSVPLFAGLSDLLAAPAWEHVRRVVPDGSSGQGMG